MTTHPPAIQLRLEFVDAVENATIGDVNVLWKLSALANDCIAGESHSQDAVAFVLSTIFALHAEDREERVLAGDDTYLMIGSGEDRLTDAISFVERGGTSDEAIHIITDLIQITPDVLYEHSS